MTQRFLVNEDGSPFDLAEVAAIEAQLIALSTSDQTAFRNGNAEHVAQHPAARSLVVSGPGTGKTTLFRKKIQHWLTKTPMATILAVSFVRKLVGDLADDILGDPSLARKQQKQVHVQTLHRFARSVLEKSHGTTTHPLEPHFSLIGGPWIDLVWEDVLQLADKAGDADYSWNAFENQLHIAVADHTAAWPEVGTCQHG